jgi:hypothetical protein
MWLRSSIPYGPKASSKANLPKLPSYLVKTVSSYLYFRTIQTSFQSATSTRHGMRAGVVQGGLVSPVLFSLYVNEIPHPPATSS